MPEETKKDQKSNQRTEGSRWHRFHFSGKVILCSVLLGFMLVLIGGILMAITTDNEDDTKSGDYNDIQKKPPTTYVGPAVMGIGGFAVIVGVFMCLFETNVCRKRTADARPLINTETAEGGSKDSDPASVPSTSHQHRHRKHKSSPSPRHKSKKTLKGKKQIEASISSDSQSSVSSPTGVDVNGSKNFLIASDKFLTPPNSFSHNATVPEECYDEHQAALMQSFTSSGRSWNTSVEFQTPAASYKDDPISLQFPDRKDEVSLKHPITITIENQNHEFLTPKNSNAEKEASTAGTEQTLENRKEEITTVLTERQIPNSYQINIPENLLSPEVKIAAQRRDDRNDFNQQAKIASSFSDNSPNVLDNELSKSSTEKKKSITENIPKSIENISYMSSKLPSNSGGNENVVCSGSIESNAHESNVSQVNPGTHNEQKLHDTKNIAEDNNSNESDSSLNDMKTNHEDISASKTDINSENNEETT